MQLSHKGNGQQVATLERAMRLSEDVIRYLTVKQDGPLPTPKSASKEDDTEKEEVKPTKDKTEKEEVKSTEDKTESPAKEEKQ